MFIILNYWVFTNGIRYAMLLKMTVVIDENPTRQRIIKLINREGQLTVTDLSRELAITPMAVRQHLLSLERKGIVVYETKKYGIGRPVFVYKLTDKAKSSFPKVYERFTLEVLRIIEETEGRERLEKIFKVRKKNMQAKLEHAFADTSSLPEKIYRLARVLDSDGCMTEVKEHPSEYHLTKYNCVLSGVTSKYPELCKHELDLYKNVFGKKVVREQCQRIGQPSCIYKIPKLINR
jgi:predicted ArsR family transcriptional regulator